MIFRALWIAFALAVVAADVYWRPAFLGLLPAGILLEGIALYRVQKDDTGSEQVWSLLYRRGRLLWARVPLVVGFVVLVSFRLYGLGHELNPDGIDIGRAALAAGFALWLIPHFVLLDRHG